MVADRPKIGRVAGGRPSGATTGAIAVVNVPSTPAVVPAPLVATIQK